MRNKRKTSKYLWCTLIAVIAACATFIYIRITVGTKHESTYQTSKDYFLSPEKLIEKKCISVCETKECIYQSKVILDHINTDVNPCEDFHHFACGRNFEKFDEYESYNIDDRYGNALFTKVKHLLDVIEAETGSASEKLKAVYDSCMAYSFNEFQAVPTVLKLLDSLGIPNWPNLASDFTFTNHDITRVIVNFLLYFEYAFIEFSTKNEYNRMKEKFIVDVKANASLAWSESFYETQDKPMRKYLVNRILNYFKLDAKTINDIWEELEAIHDAVINLRQESERMDEGNENTTTPFLDCRQGVEKEWENLCETLKSLIQTAGATDEVNEDFASMYSDEVHFMQNIFPLLRNFTDRSIGNYLAINVFLNNLNKLPSYFHLSRKKEERIYSRMRPPLLKWKKCVQWITKYMTIALGHEYLKKDFTLSMIRDVQEVGIECIKESSDLIMQQEWIKNDTHMYRQSVIERVEGIKINFDNIFEMLPNETKVNNFYELIQYHPTDDNFLHNVFAQSMKIIELKGLFQTYESDWIWDLFIVDAYGGEGQIDICFGMMLPPLYVPRGERIMKLITLGQIILHEVGHNLQEILDPNIDDFDPERNEYFQAKKKCIEDQYSQFQFESTGKKLNGSKYLRENFADTVSISVLDKLIEKYASQNTTRLLPALSYSFRQQMYIYSAQVWCSVSNKESDEYFYNKQNHAPDKFRVLGEMQNSKGFAEAFGCPAGSYLNPVKKCTILE